MKKIISVTLFSLLAATAVFATKIDLKQHLRQVLTHLKKSNTLVNGAVIDSEGKILATPEGSPGMTVAEARLAAWVVNTGKYPADGFSINHQDYLYMGKPQRSHIFRCFSAVGKSPCSAAIRRVQNTIVVVVVKGSVKSAEKSLARAASHLKKNL